METKSKILELPPETAVDRTRRSPFQFDQTAPTGQRIWSFGHIDEVGDVYSVDESIGSRISGPADHSTDFS